MATTDILPADQGIRLVRIESRPFAQNTYVLAREGRTDCLVVDPGFEPGAIIDWIDAHDLAPAALLLTHGHSDHIAGNAALRERWPDVPIVIGRHDAAKLTDPEANLSAPFGLPLTSPPADRLLDDGATVAAAGFRMVAHELPGHSRGHVVFKLEDCRPAVVLGGDVLFAGSIGRVFIPGHGPESTFGRERRTNPYVGGT